MTNLSSIREHMTVMGADGVKVGTVDRVEGDRIKLSRGDSGEGHHQGHHHYVPSALVATVDADVVWLSATAVVTSSFEEEGDGAPTA